MKWLGKNIKKKSQSRLKKGNNLRQILSGEIRNLSWNIRTLSISKIYLLSIFEKVPSKNT